MQYRPFGKTGISISALGFGAMRLPRKTIGEKMVYDHEASVALLRQGIDSGINYVDTAPGYCDRESEIIVGKALRDGYRDKVYLSTKLPGEDEGYEASRKRLETSLERLQTDHIDFYHLWGLPYDHFVQEGIQEQVRMAQRALEEGLIRHLSFSSHDKPENIIKLIDTGLFSSMLCQYNLLDRANEDVITYAAEKGLGVVIMGPIGGGRLGYPSKQVQALLPGKVHSSPEIALRFVLTHPSVSCALSGMGSPAMVEENIKVASQDSALTREERDQITRAMEEHKARANLYCTGCNYCMPCPVGVNIPLNFELMNYHRVYGLTDHARSDYATIGKVPWFIGKKASACVECGECETKCPQHLEIRRQLKETAEVMEEK
ncbi:MAG: aldo/keto reductase [Clostridiales bacterium]|nr:aldo/keto reductase [Clostridiales bacterium]